jgi:hypothetical protein
MRPHTARFRPPPLQKGKGGAGGASSGRTGAAIAPASRGPPPPPVPVDVAAMLGEGVRVKEEGNEMFKAGKYREAVAR